MTAAPDTIRVLYVDDPDSADVAARALEREDGITVRTAGSDEEGLEALAGGGVDCVVSGYDLPGRDGVAFLEAVREVSPDLPVILYTDAGSEAVASEAISAGVTGYLRKNGGADGHAALADRIRDAVTANDQEGSRQHSESARAGLEALFENSPDMIDVHDAEGNILDANARLCEETGYSGAELTEMKVWDLDQAIDPEEATDLWNRMEPGDRHRIDGIYRRQDGSTFPVEVHVRRLDLADGERFVAISRDVTEREEREAELERTRDLLDRTERIADVGGWEIDADMTDVFWTEHLFDLLGVEYGEEPPLEEAFEVLHEEDRSVVETAIQEALDTGESFDLEARYRRADGEIRRFRIQGTPTIEDGEVVSLRGAVQDVTERRERERVLREMYEVISNLDQSFDEQVRALLELGRAELGTRYGTLSEIRGEDYVFDVVATDDDSIQEGDVVPVSATNCEIAASTEQTLVLGDVARDAPGETDRAGFTEWGVSCYLGAPVYVDDDVYGTFCFYGTEAREGQFSEWEVTLVDLMSRWVSYELERRRANRRLQEQNEQLEQFVSIVSHDLRNPLSVAGGRLDLAMEDCASEHLDHVARAHDRMEELIDDLLTLARGGEQVGEIEPVDLGALVENCWLNVDTSGATIVSDLDLTIQADRSRLQQLLENLFRNAIEHGGEGVTVTVGDLDGGFYLEDDGPGIPEDERGEVFDPGHSTSEDGTGFGLSIVEGVVDAHGWEIRLTEGVEGGARFEITGVTVER
ncbi:MAG: PAS domain S-box protein [Halobacteriales archaeon]